MSFQCMLAGLGNPGQKYSDTRHNIGFMIVDALARECNEPWKAGKWQNEQCQISLGPQAVMLLKPQTFMNLSGQAIQPALAHYKLSPRQLIVVHDEIDLGFGELRFKEEGGHRGHNGLRDIKARLGSGDFIRLRVGVGRSTNPNMSVADYVLSSFSSSENSQLPELIDQSIRMLKDRIQQI